MSGVLSFGATILALMILIVPLTILSLQIAMVSTFLTGTAALLTLSRYVGKLSEENPIKTGLKYATLGMAGAAISYLVGDVLSHLTGALKSIYYNSCI